jgi:hypothetical protein
VLGHYEGSRERAARAVGAGALEFSRPLRAGLTDAAPPALDFLVRRRNGNGGRERRLEGDAIRAALRCGAARRFFVAAEAASHKAKTDRTEGEGWVRLQSKRDPSSAQKARLAREDNEKRKAKTKSNGEWPS